MLKILIFVIFAAMLISSTAGFSRRRPKQRRLRKRDRRSDLTEALRRNQMNLAQRLYKSQSPSLGASQNGYPSYFSGWPNVGSLVGPGKSEQQGDVDINIDVDPRNGGNVNVDLDVAEI